MEYKTEISEYRKFCKKYYPKHYSLRFVDNNRSDLLKMFQIINLFEILKDYDVATNEQLIPLCKMILVTLFDLLLAIPAGNELFISACVRQLSEKLLELVYSEYCKQENLPKDKLLKLRYRVLWEDGIKKSTRYKNLQSSDKQILDNINELFKIGSDTLHFKNDSSNTADYLEEIILNGARFSSKKLGQQIQKVHIFCIDLLPRILEIDFNKFSMNQKNEYINLVNYLKPKPFKANR